MFPSPPQQRLFACIFIICSPIALSSSNPNKIVNIQVCNINRSTVWSAANCCMSCVCVFNLCGKSFTWYATLAAKLLHLIAHMHANATRFQPLHQFIRLSIVGAAWCRAAGLCFLNQIPFGWSVDMAYQCSVKFMYINHAGDNWIIFNFIHGLSVVTDTRQLTAESVEVGGKLT